MKIKLIILLSIGCFFVLSVFASNQIFHYEPEVVTLTGVIKIKAFPGSFNFESVEAGDDLEIGPYIILNHPIDVVDKDEPEKNLKVIQIATSDHSGWDDKYVGKKVRVTGTLYHAISGHNHTAVLIMAEHFEFARLSK